MSVNNEFVSREALRAELEGTRMAYHALLDEIPDAAWDHPSGNPAWTRWRLKICRLTSN